MFSRILSCISIAFVGFVAPGCAGHRSADPVVAARGTPAAQTPAPAAPATKPSEPIAVADLIERFNRALRTAPDQQLPELAAIRTELLHRYLVANGNGADPRNASPFVPYYPMRRYTGGDPQLVRPDRAYLTNDEFIVYPATKTAPAGPQLSAVALFKYIQWQRAILFAERGDTVGLAGELAPGWLGGSELTQPRRAYANTFDCRGSSLCERARAAFEKAFPETCRTMRYGDDQYYCWLHEDADFADEVPGIDRSVFVDSIVTGVERQGKRRWVIHGATTGPYRTRMCKGEFHTDEIIGITERYIEIQRKTYCGGGQQDATIAGMDIRFEVDHELPVVPREGDSIRLLVHPKNITLRKSSKMSEVVARKAILTEISIPAGYRFRWNQSFDWQLNQPYSPRPR